MDKREIEAIVREVLQRAAGSGTAPGEPALGGAAPHMGGASAGAGPGTAAVPCGAQQSGFAAANGGLVRTDMPLALALELIGKIEEKAAEWNMRVVTAVSDASARPVAVHCMDGAYIGSFDVALNKTYTSIAFQMSTAQLGALSVPGESLYGIQFTNGGRIVIFGGGEVLKKEGVIVGALGVSGGTAEQDTELAAYGRRIFEQLQR